MVQDDIYESRYLTLFHLTLSKPSITMNKATSIDPETMNIVYFGRNVSMATCRVSGFMNLLKTNNSPMIQSLYTEEEESLVLEKKPRGNTARAHSISPNKNLCYTRISCDLSYQSTPRASFYKLPLICSDTAAYPTLIQTR